MLEARQKLLPPPHLYVNSSKTAERNLRATCLIDSFALAEAIGHLLKRRGVLWQEDVKNRREEARFEGQLGLWGPFEPPSLAHDGHCLGIQAGWRPNLKGLLLHDRLQLRVADEPEEEPAKGVLRVL